MMFWIGAAGYPLIELWWRGRTHPSMALAGGLAMSWLGFLHRKGKAAPCGSWRCWAALELRGLNMPLAKRSTGASACGITGACP